MITLSNSSLICRRCPFDKGTEPRICLDSISSMDDTRLSIISNPPPGGPARPIRLDFLLIRSRYSCRIAMQECFDGNKAINTAGGTEADAICAAAAAGVNRRSGAIFGGAGVCSAALSLTEAPIVWLGACGDGLLCGRGKRSFRERVEE